MKTRVALLFAGLLGVTGSVSAQGTVHAAGAGAAPAAKIVSVVGNAVLNGVGLKRNRPAEPLVELMNATRIDASTPGTVVQLECTNGGTQTLSDSFVAIINGAGAPSKCAIELKVGTALATSSPDDSEGGRASVNGGPIAAESGHTQFGVSVPRDDPANSEAFVIEGEATVKRAGETQVLKDGQMLNARTWSVARVSDARVKHLATNLARVDLQRSGAGGNVAAQADLTQKYYAALRTPGDVEARAALTRQFSTLAIPASSVTRYNSVRLKRLETYKVAPPQSVTPQAAIPQPHTPPPPGQLTVVPAHPSYTAVAKISTFQNPTVNNYRLDLCLHWGVECGAPAANEFCKTKGFSSAAQWTMATNIGAQSPTFVLGDKKVCNEASCDGFASIHCQ
jgi:hypothetical protein